MTLTVLFPRIRALRPERPVTWGDRPDKDRSSEKERTPVSLSARARLWYCGLCLLFITSPSSLYQRHLIQPDHNVIAIYPTTARSANPGPGAGARHDRVRSHCNGTRYVCHSMIAVRGGVATRKSARHSLFVNNFQIVNFYIYRCVRTWMNIQ